MHSFRWRPLGLLPIIAATQSTNAPDAIQGLSGLKGPSEERTIYVADLSQLSITRIPCFAVQLS